MGPLYKRYIPPKTPTTQIQAVPKDSQPPSSSAQAVITDSSSTKRKRDRSEGEIAERKAKKLRKKGIDPATVVQPTSGDPTSEPVRDSEQLTTQTHNDGILSVGKASPGDFSHIKNAKKRHKLEKEARKIRIDAEKVAKANKEDTHVNEVDVQAGNVTTPTAATPSIAKTKHDGAQEARLVESDTQLPTRKKRRKGDHNHESDKIVPAETAGPHDTVSIDPSDVPRDISDETSPSGHEALKNGDGRIDNIEAQPKERRHKLEAVINETALSGPEATAETDDEHLKRHGAILGKFQKSRLIAQQDARPAASAGKPPVDEPVLHDIQPFPQPEHAPTPSFQPDPSALPEWMTNRKVVSADDRKTFAELGLDSKDVLRLSKLGFKDALSVQCALIPILLPPGTPGAVYLPGTESILPDVAVSAPTGSGKTVAYLLPVIQSLKSVTVSGKLRVLIVVPTRELVVQVAAVAESLAKGCTIKVGMATGSGSFKDEQAKLIKRGRKYDPVTYKRILERVHMFNFPPDTDSADYEAFVEALEERDEKDEQRACDIVSELVDHVPVYDSAVDILVATPGRLLEHLTSTLGFTLSDLQWLILDEADKLLDQQYDGFVAAVNSEFARPRTEEEQDVREQVLRSHNMWNERRERRVRKVLLSATMTQDISKLVALQLKRPQMIVVRGTDSAHHLDERSERLNGIEGLGDGFEVPPSLHEYRIPVGDGSEKPLHLVELLKTRVLSPAHGSHDTVREESIEEASDFNTSSSGSDSSSDISSASDSDSDTDATSDTSSVSSDVGPDTEAEEPTIHPSRAAMLDRMFLHAASTPTILIFTSSTESAHRLAYALQTLQPSWKSWISTMTRSSSTPRRPSRNVNDPVIAISTDRGARGLDVIAGRPVTHVVQYDVARSVTSYVHRVGRTARVGRHGEAWTLYTHAEARWFTNEVVNGKTETRIKRAGEVEKVKISVDAGMREQLARAIGGLREVVLGGKSKSKGKK